MDELAAIDRIIELLDAPEGPTTNTSMRLPDTLREAAALAVGVLDVAPSTTMLASGALRAELERAVSRAGLEAYYAAHPEVRPSLAEVTLARALQDGLPIAHEPDVIRRAAVQVEAIHPRADPDDVLLWIEAQRSVGA